ncbi:response regulator transcription factor [Chitinophaga sp. GCM10012297]|uniref:Response regulator transcription factor n=1 Tax=Chitinophaga chungangae TaxID=2821488 RepID=A0ABS3YCQ1_9BACT|nr:response regulator transcription factor [Chitinophaga chungangae]MBO9152465.1 response regulator transcription factor [Chitinophaga chungangae]
MEPSVAVGKILVVDDETDILEIISYNLKSAGYDTVTAKDGIEAIQKAKIFRPDLIMLDIMMPNKNGIDTCREIRKLPEFKETMVLFLTALNDEKSEIEGLNMGADDYIAKPIKPKLLVSRINALFRRLNKVEEQQMHLGDLVIDREKFTVTYKGVEIILAKKEFELLQLLASKPGRVFLRNEILNQVWGTEVIVGDRTIDVHIRKIRQKLGVDLITTVKGVGYKFEL